MRLRDSLSWLTRRPSSVRSPENAEGLSADCPSAHASQSVSCVHAIIKSLPYMEADHTLPGRPHDLARSCSGHPQTRQRSGGSACMTPHIGARQAEKASSQTICPQAVHQAESLDDLMLAERHLPGVGPCMGVRRTENLVRPFSFRRWVLAAAPRSSAFARGSTSRPLKLQSMSAPSICGCASAVASACRRMPQMIRVQNCNFVQTKSHLNSSMG